MTKKLHVQIDRAKWLRGDGGASLLLDPDTGAMCCLGFVCLAMGLPESAIRLRADPAQLETAARKAVPRLTAPHQEDLYGLTPLSARAIRVNDDRFTADDRREAELVELFADADIALEFTGEGAP